MWELSWGKELDTLQEIWKTTGEKPRALRNRPQLRAMLAPYLSAFYDISNGRQYGMAGPQPITTSEVLSYCELHYISDLEGRELLLRLVRRMDAAWLTEQHRLAEAAAKK